MPEFFLELFSEEIPAGEQKWALGLLEGAVWDLANELDQNVSPEYDDWLKGFSGPRRLAVSAKISAEKAGQVFEVRGPKESAPDTAIDGFLRKHTAHRNDLIIEAGHYLLRQNIAPEPADAFIQKRLPELINTKLDWPNSMRWGQGGDFAWVRPLRSIVCILDGVVVPVTLGPITAGDETQGHRVMGHGAFKVASATDWEDQLRTNFVLASAKERDVHIERGLAAAAKKMELEVVNDAALMHEVNGLVEWPVPLIGQIDEKFMDLPPEVRELSMKLNQKYFALRNVDGTPAPYFAFVANLEASDGGAAVIAGNERVLRARLSDASHFWNLDLKTPLDQLLPKLERITFHAKLGTQRQRADRIAHLAELIASWIATQDISSQANAEIAGLLCKADLVTGMVGEFPELQGTMGGYYATRSHGAEIGRAISTHYQPKGPSDTVPRGIVAVAVALADKLDTLREFFAAGEKPTGSGDPYALRRAALGVIRIILENDLRLHLKLVPNSEPAIFDFIIERLRVKLRGEGKRFDVLDAVLAAGIDDDLVRVMKRTNALGIMIETDHGKSLLAGYKRAANIIKIEDAKDGPHTGNTDQRLFSNIVEEQALFQALTKVQEATYQNILDEDYASAMSIFATLHGPIDAFFKHVTVNDAEPTLRRNRLALLARFRDTVDQIADFSKLEG